MNNYLRVLTILCLTPLVAAPSAAAAEDGQPAKTCAELKQFAGTEETKAAADGKWAKTVVGPIFRSAVINARAAKRIQAQCAAEQRTADAVEAKAAAEAAAVDSMALLVEDMGYRRALSAIEEKRFDKQIGASASNAGTTSPTSKGTVPSLLGFAVENGALLRSVSGTTITFQAVPLNIVKALAAHDYVASAPNPQPGTPSSLLSDVSVSVSFDASRGSTSNTFTGDQQQISGYGARYQIVNWRDPRNVRYAREWEKLRTDKGARLAERLNTVNAMLRANTATTAHLTPPSSAVEAAFDAWRAATIKSVDEASVDGVEKVIAAAAAQFKAIAERSPALMAEIAQAGKALSDYFVERNEIADVAKSLVMALEYTGSKQAQTTTTPAGPDLSNLKLVFGKGFRAGPELTGNVGFTLFNTVPSTATAGRVRDVQASVQLDVPLPEIQNIGKMVFSLSALVDHLRQEPLGQPLLINTVSVKAAGTIGLVQAKVTIPTKGTGVAIPISVTWSNRTDLILDKTTRLNVGMTLDFDKLFAKQ